jgi:RNA polymerase sigma-70 factor (ECF subfamily)
MSECTATGVEQQTEPREPRADNLMAVVSHYQGPLLRYVGRMLGESGEHGGPEDIVQETFTRLHRQICAHGAGSIGHLTTWLFRVAHNLALDALRRGVRRDAPQASTNAVATTHQQAEEMDALGEIIREEARQAVLHELNELDDLYRHVVLLKVVQGMSLRQVAEVVGVSVSTVNYRLNQGLSLLAQRLRRAGVV